MANVIATIGVAGNNTDLHRDIDIQLRYFQKEYIHRSGASTYMFNLIFVRLNYIRNGAKLCIPATDPRRAIVKDALVFA